MSLKQALVTLALATLGITVIFIMTPGRLSYVPVFVQFGLPVPTTTGLRVPPPAPAATPADTVSAQNNHSFQLLVSYTDTGFEPRTTTIHAGDTVRFTNNSTRELWVAASGSKLYPRAQGSCGSSALDSCAPFAPGHVWEFTFKKSGTWSFVNNMQKSDMGTVHVQ